MTPVGKYLLASRENTPEKIGRIILPAGYYRQEPIWEGRVVAVSPDTEFEVKPGDRIFFAAGGCQPCGDLLQMTEETILYKC